MSKLPGLYPYIVEDAILPLVDVPWNLANIGAPGYWQKTKGAGVVVAVVDTGLDVTHPEIAGRVIGQRSFIGNNILNVTDEVGHGTHVAGTIAGRTCGVAPEARIMPIKVFGAGNTDGYQFQDAMKYIIDWNKTCSPEDRVVAINCSWGGGGADTVLNYLMRKLVLSGVSIPCAAGNSGDGDPTTHEVWNYPAYWHEVITTGAVDRYEKPAGFTSSYDGVDIGAPGVQIYSAWPENLGGGYKLLSGTSMATPHVTGACALLTAAFRMKMGRFPTADQYTCQTEIEPLLWINLNAVNIPDEFVGRGLLSLKPDIIPPKRAKKIVIVPGAYTMTVDGVGVMLDQPAFITGVDRTMMPIRAIAENQGYIVEWIDGQVILTDPS